MDEGEKIMNCLTTNVWFELNEGICEVSLNAAEYSYSWAGEI